MVAQGALRVEPRHQPDRGEQPLQVVGPFGMLQDEPVDAEVLASTQSIGEFFDLRVEDRIAGI